MYRIIIIFLLLILCVKSYPLTNYVLELTNEFGGKTVVLFPVEGDEELKDHIVKMIEYNDSNNVVRKRETYFDEIHQQKHIYYKGVVYFDENKKRIKSEIYLHPKASKIKGYYLQTTYYLDGDIYNVSRIEFYFIEDFIKSEGITKAVNYYSNNIKYMEDTYYSDEFFKKNGYNKTVTKSMGDKNFVQFYFSNDVMLYSRMLYKNDLTN
jgi:hypothetical protein